MELPRENTKMWPFEFTATPAISPKCTSGGMVNGSGTDSNGSSGTAAVLRGYRTERHANERNCQEEGSHHDLQRVS